MTDPESKPTPKPSQINDEVRELMKNDPRVLASDPDGEIHKRYVPLEPQVRDVVVTLAAMIALIPTIPHEPNSKERYDPASLLWRTETLRDALKKILADAQYAPPEAHAHFWMRGATLMREHIPDILALQVEVAGAKVDGYALKRAGQTVPDAAKDGWERAVMRVWIPSAFAPGGRWHLTTNAGKDQ